MGVPRVCRQFSGENVNYVGVRTLLCLVMLFTGTYGQDEEAPDIVMLYHSRHLKVICVAGNNTEGSGIMFIKPLSDNNQVEFKYRNRAGYLDTSNNCDFKPINKCTEEWNSSYVSIASSIIFNKIFAPFLNDQWNGFYTGKTFGDSSPDYGNYILVPERIFHISVSIFSARDAQILLCQHVKGPRTNSCYWIIIDGFEGKNVTALRKCVKGVPDKWPKDATCRSHKSNYTAKLLNENEWRHFTVSRNNENQILLWELNEGHVPILNYTDHSPINVNLMFLRSYNYSIAEWKIHDYNLALLKTPNNQIVLWKAYQEKEKNTICLSLDVALCSTCSLQLMLQNTDSYMSVNSTIQGTADIYIQWQNVRLIMDVREKNDFHRLYAYATSEENTENPFWAITNFRMCSEDEIRQAIVYFYKNVDVSCQSLKHPQWKFKKDIDSSTPDRILECSDPQYTGRKCNIACRAAVDDDYDYCENYKICSAALETEGSMCSCGSGLKWPTCDKVCDNKFYGYNCEKECGECSNCSKTTGVCEGSCYDEYIPPYCNIIMPCSHMDTLKTLACYPESNRGAAKL